MNPDPANPASTPSEAAPAPLQFETAEFAQGAALSCEVCKTPLQGEYFQANGKNICPSCRTKIDTAITSGSKFARFGKAAGAGLAGGFAGFLIYWAVATFFHMELGLIAIAVGWMVGAGVRWGSDARGGLFYQSMAAIITYVSICSSYLPLILSAKHAAGIPFVFKFIFSFFIALAAPWLEGPGNIIGWVIIAIGLYQAWVMNRKTPIQFTGPYSTAKAPAA